MKKLLRQLFLICFTLASMLPLLVACGGPGNEGQRDRRLSDQELAELSARKNQDHGAYYFGFDLRASPQEDARQYLPFLAYLKRATGYDFELRFTAKGEDIIDDLGSDKVQFAAIGAVGFIEANRRYGARILVRGINASGESASRSYFVVQPDSPIQRIEDLRRQRLAFSSKTSTQGFLIPRIMLYQHGLRLKDLGGYIFTGSHQNCADAVVSQRADACGMQGILAQRLAEQGLVRVLHRSGFYPSSGIVANNQVPEEIVAKVRQALLAFEPAGRDAEGLYAWERTEMPLGFEAARAEDYQELEQWMQKLGEAEGR